MTQYTYCFFLKERKGPLIERKHKKEKGQLGHVGKR